MSLSANTTRHLVFFRVLLFFFLAFFIPCSAFAETPLQDTKEEIQLEFSLEAEQTTSDPAASPTDLIFFPESSQPPTLPFEDPYYLSLRIATSLALVIAIIFALSWFIQKKTGLAGSPFGKIIGILPLDSRKYIYLVDIMGKMLILGVTDHHISLISEVTDKSSIDGLRLQSQSSGVVGLEKLFDFLKNRNPEEESSGNSASELETHSQKAQSNIKKMTDLLLERKRNSHDE